MNKMKGYQRNRFGLLLGFWDPVLLAGWKRKVCQYAHLTRVEKVDRWIEKGGD